jgi:uncharacterized protein (DUF2235 family)
MSPGGKRIALFLDGTWNTVSDNTNIWRMRALCAETSIDGARQTIYYDQGVGTRFGEYFCGGMFGYGLDRNVRAAYRWLIETYSPGDDIFLFGFSRGAFTARSLTGLIARCGLLQRRAALVGRSLRALPARRRGAADLPTPVGKAGARAPAEARRRLARSAADLFAEPGRRLASHILDPRADSDDRRVRYRWGARRSLWEQD